MANAKVSTFTVRAANVATFTYAYVAANGAYGRVALNATDGLPIYVGDVLHPSADKTCAIGGATSRWTGMQLQQAGAGVVFTNDANNQSNAFMYDLSTGPRFKNVTAGISLVFDQSNLTTDRTAQWQDHDGIVAWVDSQTFTGVPRAPTPALGDDSTTLATTAFVNADIPYYSVAAPAIATITSGNETDVSPTTVVANFLMISAGTLTAYTIKIANGLYDGQIVFMSFNHIITTLTLGGTNFSTAGLAQPTTTIANQCIGWCWDVTSTKWVRFQ